MKLTLLELTQDVLNDIDGDEVNSIDDTIESVQVAQIIKSTYFALMDIRDWPHTRKLMQIEPSGTTALPTHMYLPDNFKKVSLVNYDKARITDGAKRVMQEIKYTDPDDFLRVSNQRNNTQANYISVVDPSTAITLVIRNDLPPTYYTSFDDKTLVFDSYDSAVDSTLQKHKVQVFAYIVPDWSHVDTFIPDLPDGAFTLLLEESKSRAAVKIRQQADNKAEQEAGRQSRKLARDAQVVGRGIKFPNYGRNGRMYQEPTFRRDN